MNDDHTEKNDEADERVSFIRTQLEEDPWKPSSTPPPSPSRQLYLSRRVRHYRLSHLRQKRRLGPMGIALTGFLIMVLLGCGTLTAGYFYYKTTIQSALQGFNRPVSRGKNEPTPTIQQSYDNIQGRSWNILLLGSDNDNKFSFPYILTQVMMIVHVDTTNNTVNMVSIPRDSWVSVPEVGGMHKIDQAFLLGAERERSFEGGVRLARETIEKDYGVTIDRYAWVGLDGFAKVIDTLGGVDVDITHPVVDDTYPDDASSGSDPNDPYAYKRLYLVPGPQHLNGEQALEYVRSRHSDLLGDIGRTMRQQQVLDALKNKLNTSSILNNLSQLLQDMQGKLYTDFNEQELISFANYGHSLPGNAIQRITLGPGKGANNFGALSTVYDPMLGADQSVIIPNCVNIQPVINRIFGLAWYDVSCNVTG